jgi:HAMP domain-containing protein
MDLRTKLVFALVTVALGSMLALGFASYPLARDLLRDSSLRILDGVAESKANDLENLANAWSDRVSLIASRTQLRISIAAWGASHDPAERDRILRILGDAVQSAPAVRMIAALDADGHPVVSTGDSVAPSPTREAIVVDPARGVVYTGLRRSGSDAIEVGFRAPLELNGRNVGTLHVVLSARELLDITGDYTGLGETGEIMIAERVGPDTAVIVNPTRHGGGPPLARRIGLDRPGDLVVKSVLGGTSGRPDRAIDYRDMRVWAATRTLPALEWGLVVKFDAEEQERPVEDLRRYMVRVALALSAFAILGGTILGLNLTRPIRNLADVANRIRSGDLDARAETRGDDEIGVLARTFNLMAAKLIETNRELERRVEENHGDIGEPEPPAGADPGSAGETGPTAGSDGSQEPGSQ